jgi:GT2 family glycosyltransferase
LGSPHDSFEGDPNTTLLICSSGRSTMLAEVVEQILGGERVPSELIVVENAQGALSPLATLRTDFCRYRYVPTSLSTLSEKRNLALMEATHDLIVICDDDVAVPSTWFGSLVDALLRAGTRTIVTGRVLAGEPEVAGGFAPSLHPSSQPAAYGRRSTLEDPLATFNCAFHRRVFDAVGEFDARMGPGTAYPSCEDNDFGFRATELGFTLLFEPEALLYHRAWRPPGDFIRLRFRYGLGQGAFYAKHLGIDGFIWRKMLAAWTRHARRTLPVGYRTTVGELAWFAGFAVGLPHWLAQHRIPADTRPPRTRAEP